MAAFLHQLLCVGLLVTLAGGLPITNPSNEYLPISSDTDPDQPVVDSGDKTPKESGYTKPALKYLQNLLVDVLHPKPIVDSIREEEKYGNDGGKLDIVGRGIVTGVEKVTNFISSAVDIPFDALKGFTRKATETLNNIGSKLVGI